MQWDFRVVRVRVTKLLIFFLITVSVLGNATAEEMMGSDSEPNLEETVILSVEHTTPSRDLEEWTISVTIDEDSSNNGTILELTTQICINSGVCFAPESQNMSTDDNTSWTASVITPEDHSYVNWRLTAHFEQGEQIVPETGWAKTWSTCWVSFDSGGGVVSGGDGCADEESGGLPSVGGVLTAATLIIVAFSRRNQYSNQGPIFNHPI